MIYLKKIKITLLIFLIAIILSGCADKESLENKKIEEEISYIDSKIISMLNKLNNIDLETYKINSNEITLQNNDKKEKENSSKGNSDSGSQGNSENNGNDENSIEITKFDNSSVLDINTGEIKWEEIKNDIETINESWNIIKLELFKINNNSDVIQSFGNSLNNCIIAIKNEDKLSSMIALPNLYSFLPAFLSQVSQDKSLIATKQTKAYIVSAYSNVDQNNWDNALADLTNAETEFLKVMNDLEFSKGKESKINSIYINLKELQNVLSTKDLNLFLIHYKNILKEINKI